MFIPPLLTRQQTHCISPSRVSSIDTRYGLVKTIVIIAALTCSALALDPLSLEIRKTKQLIKLFELKLQLLTQLRAEKPTEPLRSEHIPLAIEAGTQIIVDSRVLADRQCRPLGDSFLLCQSGLYSLNMTIIRNFKPGSSILHIVGSRALISNSKGLYVLSGEEPDYELSFPAEPFSTCVLHVTGHSHLEFIVISYSGKQFTIKSNEKTLADKFDCAVTAVYSITHYKIAVVTKAWLSFRNPVTGVQTELHRFIQPKILLASCYFESTIYMLFNDSSLMRSNPTGYDTRPSPAGHLGDILGQELASGLTYNIAMSRQLLIVWRDNASRMVLFNKTTSGLLFWTALELEDGNEARIHVQVEDAKLKLWVTPHRQSASGDITKIYELVDLQFQSPSPTNYMRWILGIIILVVVIYNLCFKSKRPQNTSFPSKVDKVRNNLKSNSLERQAIRKSD